MTDEPVWTPKSMNERQEAELIGAFGRLVRQAGPEVYELMEQMIVELIAPQEEEIRRTDPTSPALKVLDARRLRGLAWRLGK